MNWLDKALASLLTPLTSVLTGKVSISAAGVAEGTP